VKKLHTAGIACMLFTHDFVKRHALFAARRGSKLSKGRPDGAVFQHGTSTHDSPHPELQFDSPLSS
jgi:hypothetical protein